MKTNGQIGYEAYATSTGGRTYDGKQMPLWTSLPTNITAAWEAAARAVLDRAPPSAPRTAEEGP